MESRTDEFATLEHGCEQLQYANQKQKKTGDGFIDWSDEASVAIKSTDFILDKQIRQDSPRSLGN